jgi:hypothetical protein
MAPPWRVLCLACVKSKRKCDLGTPNCGRCTARTLLCQYRPQSPSNSPPEGHEPNLFNYQAFDIESDLGQIQMEAPQAIELGRIETSPILPGLTSPPIMDQLLPDLTGVADDTDDSSGLIQITPDDYYKTTGKIYEARVSFAAAKLKTLPTAFFQRGINCFIHSDLYDELPIMLQHALSARVHSV